MKTFAEFWPFYVAEHARPLTRTLHFIGSTGVLVLLALAIVRGPVSLLALVPIAGYGFAWGAHLFVEKNRPATFTYPLWSLAADWVMYAKILTGKMDAEVERIVGIPR